jgi:hypothetical protein
MGENEKRHTFDRTTTVIDNRPQIYIISKSERKETYQGPDALRTGRGDAAEKIEGTAQSTPFFGHHIGKLIAGDRPMEQEFLPIDKKLESSLEIVRQKLQRTQGGFFSKGKKLSEEEIKHRRFIEERNAAQEVLFEDILDRHREFATGFDEDDLWSLHDLLRMEGNHELVCGSEESIHELVECNLLTFLRRKAGEQAWQQLEEYLIQFHILFPMSPSMEDRAKPARNEKIRDERKKSVREEFLKTPALQLAELILGNVPVWVYSYPRRDTYLWQLIVLQGVAAGLEANLLMRYLSVWEESSGEIFGKIQQEFGGKIDGIRQRGESAVTLPDVLSVSKDLERMSTEEVPERVWKYIRAKLGIS